MRAIMVIGTIMGVALLLVPAVLVIAYPGWNDAYYFALSFTAGAYGFIIMVMVGCLWGGGFWDVTMKGDKR